MWKNRRIVSIGWHYGNSGGQDKCGWVVYFPKTAEHLTFSGDAAILCRQCIDQQCPTGILLDRLEEYPHEGGKPKSLVLAAVGYYRARQQGK